MKMINSKFAVAVIACLTTLTMLAGPALAKDDSGTGTSQSSETSKEDKKAQKEADKKAKEDKKAEEEAAKEAEKDAKEAEKQAEKDEKEAEKEAKKAEKEDSNEADEETAESDSTTQSSSTGSTQGSSGSKNTQTFTAAKSGGKCVSYYFRYTDGHVDTDDNWCGGNDIYRTDVPTLHVAKLHVSCSDTIYPDGTAKKADLDGHLVAEWSIVKDGKECQGFVTTAPELCPDGTDMAGEPMPEEGVEGCNEPEVEVVLCPAGTDMAGEPMPEEGVEGCDEPEVVSVVLCPAGTDLAGKPMPSGDPELCSEENVLASTASAQEKAATVAGVALPFTGGDVLRLVAIALLLMIAGLATLRASSLRLHNKN